MEKRTIVTHPGIFHADDLFAVATMMMLGIEFDIIRTRDPEAVEKADFKIDIGGKYDWYTRCYDHHQDHNEIRDNGIPYASFGLIWKHFGHVICQSDPVAKIVDRNLVQIIDAGDTGIKLTTPLIKGVRPLEIAWIVYDLNPWDVDNPDYDRAFMDALPFARTIISNQIRRADSIAKMRPIVRRAIEESMDERVVVLENETGPWQDILVNETNALFVIFRSTEGDWKVQCVPKEVGSFDMRKSLPSNWAGLKDDDLSTITGVQGCIFCHKKLFIAGNKTRYGAVKLAKLAFKE